jgi:hypothetical protein
MEMKLILVLLAVSLQGCAQYALEMNKQDPCQTGKGVNTAKELNRPEGYTAPSWCGSTRGRVFTVTQPSHNTYIIQRY